MYFLVCLSNPAEDNRTLTTSSLQDTCGSEGTSGQRCEQLIIGRHKQKSARTNTGEKYYQLVV